tara:strand:+ start:6165 stop:6785 length:621 start_codon:yes stop_codon:yes gene_type:complete
MRGDVDAVRRLERRDKRADKAGRKLKLKLDKKSRNQRVGLRATRGRPVQVCSLGFAASTTLIAHLSTKASRTRLLACRDSRGKRVFFVSELLAGFEETAALIVAPRSEEASPERIGREIAEGESGWQSRHRVALIQTDESLSMGGCEGSLILLSKIGFADGQAILYVAPGPGDTPTFPPRLLGLDSAIHARITREAAKMLGVELDL